MLGLWKPEMPESIEASRAQWAESNLAENQRDQSALRRRHESSLPKHFPTIELNPFILG